MPITNTWEARGVYRKFTGSFSRDDLRLAQDEVYGNPHFDRISYVVNDFLEAQPDETINELDAQLGAAFASAALRINSRLRHAAVATDPGVLELLNAYLSTPVSPFPPSKIFPTLVEARQWVEG